MGFRNDFVWGAATSAYQIEGGAYEDGKGLNIFDTFCSIPGRILNNDTGNTACDHYHRWKEDIALMKRIGIKEMCIRDRVYHEQTAPLKDFYEKRGKLETVVGQEDVADTSKLTLKAVEA